MPVAAAGGALALADDLVLSRMGYGAMQLAGPGVFGPPKDRDEAIAVLRTAVDLGVTHIDTSGFYGPATVNEVIPGTSSVSHLRENVAAADLVLAADAAAELDAISPARSG